MSLLSLCLPEPDRTSRHTLFFSLAIEAQAFSLRVPECFFSMYSPVRSGATARAERDRLMEDIRFVAKSVRRPPPSPPLSILPLQLALETQIANVCITLNEFPYIRYYAPSDHGPLGALRPHESARPAAAAAAAPRLQPENSLRWRTNLARGEQSRQHEAAEAEVLSRILAFEVQAALEEFKRANPEFPVRACFLLPSPSLSSMRRLTGRVGGGTTLAFSFLFFFRKKILGGSGRR